MNDGPHEREEHDTLALQFEEFEFAPRTAVGAVDGHQHQGRGRFDQRVGAAVDHAELETHAILIRRNQSIPAEADTRRRFEETPEQKAAWQRRTPSGR